MITRTRVGRLLMAMPLAMLVVVSGCLSPEEIARREAEALYQTQEAAIKQTAEALRLTAEARVGEIIPELPVPRPDEQRPRFVRLPVATSEWNNGFGANTFAQQYWADYYTLLGGLHNGLDFGTEAKTIVYAGLHGKLIGTSGDALRPGGNVVVTVGNYLVTYGHTLRDKSLIEGQEITPDTVIGTIADDGSNDHMHLSIKSGGRYYNPLFFFENGLIDPDDWGPYAPDEGPYSIISYKPLPTNQANYWTKLNIEKLEIQR